MAVCAEVAVPALLEDPAGLLHGCLAVVSDKGGEVQLEVEAHLVEPFVGRFREVAVSLRVCKQRAVSCFLDLAEGLIQAGRRVPCGGLQKEGVVFHGEEVSAAEAFLEEGVKHIFCCKVQADIAFIRCSQLLEPGLKFFSGVGHVLHDVRGAPEVSDACGLKKFQDLEGFLKGLDAVVHAEEDVAVTVGPAFEGFPAQEGIFLFKEAEDAHLNYA